MDTDTFRRAQERYDAMEHPDYWRKEVNEELEGERPTWCSDHGRWECDCGEGVERAFDGEDAEEWQRRSEEQGTE